MTLTDDLLGLRLGADAAAPLVTYYDDATGERIELSGTTLANWAAKTANLLREECDLEPGGSVAVLLPAHWQTAAVLLAVWSCGAEVTADPDGADLVLCDANRVDVALAAKPTGGVVALSMDAFGRGIDGLPAGVVDFATEVRLQPDAFVPWEPVTEAATALDGRTVAEVLVEARDRVDALGLAATDRVLSTREWTTLDGLRDGLLAVLAAGASLVQVAHPEDAALERRYVAEKCSTRL